MFNLTTDKENHHKEISEIFNTLLKRNPVQIEIDHYTSQLDAGIMTVSDIVNKIKSGNEYLQQQVREIQLINKYSKFKEPFFELDKKIKHLMN